MLLVSHTYMLGIELCAATCVHNLVNIFYYIRYWYNQHLVKLMYEGSLQKLSGLWIYVYNVVHIFANVTACSIYLWGV